MDSVIRGLHHVTATTDGAQQDVDFYLRALGLRLVKKTVNFDNPGVYHFYYGNERGTPGTLMTTFPYKGRGVPVGIQGAGQITATSFSVPGGSLDSWRERLRAAGCVTEEETERFGDAVTVTRDPSGLRIELVEAPDDPREPWVPEGGDPATAARGVHSVTLSIRDPRPSIEFLTRLLGWSVVGEEKGRTRLAADRDLPGHRIEILHAPDAPTAVNGLGTVHHVAMAVDDDDAQMRVRERLVREGVLVTPVKDRQYFRSIYFREPGGVLYEVATIPPGFLVDEDLSSLGTGLKLPSWEEHRREMIEAALTPVTT